MSVFGHLIPFGVFNEGIKRQPSKKCRLAALGRLAHMDSQCLIPICVSRGNISGVQKLCFCRGSRASTLQTEPQVTLSTANWCYPKKGKPSSNSTNGIRYENLADVLDVILYLYLNLKLDNWRTEYGSQ